MKASPHSLRPKQRQTFVKTFVDYANPRFTCSCGHSFNTPGDCPLMKPKEEDKHIVKENEPYMKFDMTFRKVSRMEVMSLVTPMQELIQRYVTGYGLPGKKDYIPPENLPPLHGEQVTVSESAIQLACLLAVAQLMPEAERYTVEDLIMFMYSDSILDQMSEVAADLQDGGDGDASPLVTPITPSSGTP